MKRGERKKKNKQWRQDVHKSAGRDGPAQTQSLRYPNTFLSFSNQTWPLFFYFSRRKKKDKVFFLCVGLKKKN